jgi:5-formyltetrahydrofolate cyclo-ligase
MRNHRVRMGNADRHREDAGLRPQAEEEQPEMDEDKGPAAGACSSPPCMLNEALTPDATQALPMPDAAAEWAEVRLWRKAKRQVLIERRLEIAPADRAAHRGLVTASVSALLAAARPCMVGFYWPFKGEFDPRPMVEALHGEGVRFALPVVVQKARPLIFRAWSPGMPMQNGIWDIPVPASGEPLTPDLLLVPLLGFDKRGYRLGYGGGYYDRTLAAMERKPRTIGIGFERLEVPTIFPQPHDIRMDCIVTERRTLEV